MLLRREADNDPEHEPAYPYADRDVPVHGRERCLFIPLSARRPQLPIVGFDQGPP